MKSFSIFKTLLLFFILVSQTTISRAVDVVTKDQDHPKGAFTKEQWSVHFTLNKADGVSETLDLSCEDDTYCQSFAVNTKTSSCINGTCICQEKNFNQSISCGNLSAIKSQKVGSPCENEPPYCRGMGIASCDDASNTCRCDEGFVETVDKRRCIAVEVSLSELCELDEQCIRSDTNSICGPSRACTCVEKYINRNGTCRENIPLGDPEIVCEHSEQCQKEVNNSICFNQKCVCGTYYTASNDRKSCLPDIFYRMPCLEDQQCQHRSGTGSTCNEKCLCRDRHAILKIGYKFICTKQIYPGDYCQTQEDCSIIMGVEPNMECFNNACVCRKKFIIPGTDERCIEVSSSATLIVNSIFCIILLICVLFLN